ncbi:cubilin-like isoform X2 [Tachypleus tridentatus]|uniref:cubilin-like isoform X2 n=1 Tax=Tachypleus tridentatus TaxID=6853 RepID=UPI003FD2FA79
MTTSYRQKVNKNISWCYTYELISVFFLVAYILTVVSESAAVSVVTSFPPTRAPKCDRLFVSNTEDTKNGTFESPVVSNLMNHSRQCIYVFIAAEDERVKITFNKFNLRGAPPECNHEFIDLYTEIDDPGKELIETPFGGRYCGKTLPRTRISMYQTLTISFYSDASMITPDAFQGTYEFVNASKYSIGTPAPSSVCTFTIYHDRKKEGLFVSPTYPGVYPKNLHCQYRFLGRAGQRVRLEFMDFDLFYGGPHCPFDHVKVFDGKTKNDPLIGTYCGQRRNLMVYSSAENLYVEFNTLRRTADTQNRGFSGFFEFSEGFVNLECDQKILSKQESNGTVFSPNWPFLYYANIVCRYYIYGMKDAQYLEKVRLEFDKFEIPSKDEECNEAYLKLYLQGQEERNAVDEYDHVFCGETTPPTLVSDGPRLMLIFSSGSSQGKGFKARYTFETDYRVPGTPSPNRTCHFIYKSESKKTGDFNSPRYPSNYPSSTYCQYVFKGLPGEQVQFVFNYFKTKSSLISSHGYNEMCTEDWIEIYEVYPSGRENKFGRYCSRTAPGPVVSDVGVHDMKVMLNTDNSDVASGFSATYLFFPSKPKFSDCGGNMTGTSNGIITSPGFPSAYEPHRQICNWHITVQPFHKVLLSFNYFLIEGDPLERGCPGAVVRVWSNLSLPPMELCGERMSNQTHQILSSSSELKLQFVTADKAVGSGGFRAVWTEVKEAPTTCKHLLCERSRFCISSALRCNEISNCGFDDDTDEKNCTKEVSMDIYLVVGLSVGAAAFSVLALCAACRRKRKRRGDNVPAFEHRPQPPREVPSMHLISMESV